VVLAGGRAPSTTLGSYGRAFDALFPAIAAAQHVALAPDLLAGVMDRPAEAGGRAPPQSRRGEARRGPPGPGGGEGLGPAQIMRPPTLLLRAGGQIVRSL